MRATFRPCSLRSVRAAARSNCPARAVSRQSRSHRLVTRSSVDEYTEALLSHDGDWTRTLELMTEVNVLKLELPPAALEAAIVSYANGGQLKRAEDLYRKLDAPSAAVTTALVECLAGSHEGASRAAVLLDELASAGGQQQGHLSSAYNLVARALARQGSIDEAHALITRMMRSEVLQVEGRTFTSVATCCMNVERTELAEELLEMRDYL